MTMSRRRDATGAAEAAFRRLRDELSLQGGALPALAVLVTSARRGEGRTSVAVGLARAFARTSPGSVVLADFDLLQPSLHRLFDRPAGPGVSEVLRGEVPLESALSPVAGGALLLLRAGAGSEDVGPLLGSAAMVQLMSDLRARAKTVILDSTPVASGPEVHAAAALADGVVLVVRADRTIEREARAACARLRAAGANVVGVVLNAGREQKGGAAALPLHRPAPRRDAVATAEPASRTPGKPSA
jgi:succinoglycan biosynthesis transport protein ExoP